MVIYKITNILTEEIYIGQTTRPINERWQEHTYNSSSPLLKIAIQKYGVENFTIEIIEKCKNIKKLTKREQYWINHYDSLQNGYNSNRGGNGPLFHTEKAKQKISNASKVRQNKESYKLAASETAKKQWINQEMSKKQKEIIVKNNKKQSVRKKRKETNLIKNRKKFSVHNINGEFIGIWENKSTCAEDLNLLDHKICACLKGTRNYHKNYIFKYCEVI